jgi:hypothetical protein
MQDHALTVSPGVTPGVAGARQFLWQRLQRSRGRAKQRPGLLLGSRAQFNFFIHFGEKYTESVGGREVFMPLFYLGYP